MKCKIHEEKKRIQVCSLGGTSNVFLKNDDKQKLLSRKDIFCLHSNLQFSQFAATVRFGHCVTI